MKNKYIKLVVFTLVLCLTMLLSATSPIKAEGLVADLFDFSIFRFTFTIADGRRFTESDNAWGAADEEEKGFGVDVTGLDTVNIHISASNSKYQKVKPVLLWIHKGDSLFDMLDLTDKEAWYTRELEETLVLCKIPYTGEDIDIETRIPLDIKLDGIINGGYLVVEFFDEKSIPEKLKFAYEIQSYTLEELEEYIKYNMDENIENYYNIDTGFRTNINGVPFRNTDYANSGGNCAGISTLSSIIFNGYEPVKEFKHNDRKYSIDDEYIWYNQIYINKDIHNVRLADENLLNKNSPSKNIETEDKSYAYPLVKVTSIDENDTAFFSLLDYYHSKNNFTALLRGNAKIENMDWKNLENKWSIIDYIASFLRQGKVVMANISTSEGGHTIVGYRLEKVADKKDTYRLYCYDSNYPDDMTLKYEEGHTGDDSVDEDGRYKYIKWVKNDNIYIEITKKTVEKLYSFNQVKEVDVFEFDTSHTSMPASSKNGDFITFTVTKNGDKIGVLNYSNPSNEIINIKAFPVIKDNKTVTVRTFAYYKSGEVQELTNSKNLFIKMNYNFLGEYKIKNSTITLTKDGYRFDNSGTNYIECYIAYDDANINNSEIKLRIPIK